MAASNRVVERGQQALSQAQWTAARQAFEAALREGETPDALEGLGMAAWWLDDADTVFETRERAYRLYRRDNDRRSAARVALALAEDYLYFRGESAVSRGWHRRAHALLDGLGPYPEHVWLKVSEGDFAISVDQDAAAAQKLAAEAVALARALEQVDVEMVALALEGFALVCEGRSVEGMSRLDETTTAALSGELTDPLAVGFCCCYLMSACERVRDLDRATQWCARVKAFCERVQFNALFAVCRTQYASVLLWSGAWADAEEELEAAVRQFAISRPPLQGEGIVRLAELRRRQGRFDEARELLERAEGHPLATLERAALALELGDAGSAARLAERFLRSVPDENRAVRLNADELRLRACVALGDQQSAATLANEIESSAHALRTAPARATARLARGLALRLAGDFDGARQALEDAVDLFVRAGSSFEAARARLDLSCVLADLRQARAAAAEARAALDVFKRLGAAYQARRAGALLKKFDDPGIETAGRATHLTRRELEVLRLVAEGRTNSQIGAALVVSDLTVKRHVANILTKLDLPSRAAAAAYAARHGLIRDSFETGR